MNGPIVVVLDAHGAAFTLADGGDRVVLGILARVPVGSRVPGRTVREHRITSLRAAGAVVAHLRHAGYVVEVRDGRRFSLDLDGTGR